jgi:hypothetical protein
MALARGSAAGHDHHCVRNDGLSPLNSHQHRLVFDRSSLTRWRQRMGEERLQALLQESLSVATRTEAIQPSDLNRVIVDTTVQPKNVMFPTDARLLPARSWSGWRNDMASSCASPIPEWASSR